jgi:hypothetical protein
MFFIRMGEILSVDVAERILHEVGSCCSSSCERERRRLAWLRRASVVDCSRTIELVGI